MSTVFDRAAILRSAHSATRARMTPSSSGITRRAVLQVAGLALATRLTSIASSLFDWLSFDWLFMTGWGLRLSA